MRKRVLGGQLALLERFRNVPLVVENKLTGMQVVDFNDIVGFSYTTALTTVAIARRTSNITVNEYFKSKGKELDYPQMPLLIVRRDSRPDAEAHYDFIPLERIYFRDANATSPRIVAPMANRFKTAPPCLEPDFTPLKPSCSGKLHSVQFPQGFP